MNGTRAQNFWPPLAAGVGLGLTLLAMFLMTGHGLGAGIAQRLSAWLAYAAVPAWTEANAFFSPLVSKGHPLDAWITWEVVGVALGALIASLSARRFHLRIERGPRVAAAARLALALGGGVLTGFGAQLATGCTSGLGLSGAATLSVAAFVFLLAFFAAGLLLAPLVRRLWQ